MTIKEYKNPVAQLLDKTTRPLRDYVAFGPESDLHNVQFAIDPSFNPAKGLATVYTVNVLSATATPVNVYVNFKTVDPATVAKRFTLLWYTGIANNVNAIANALASIAPSDLTPEQTTAIDLLLTRIESVRKGYDSIITPATATPVDLLPTDPATVTDPATLLDMDMVDRSNKLASALYHATVNSCVPDYKNGVEEAFTQVKASLEAVPATDENDIATVDLRDLRGKLNHFGKTVCGRKFNASATLTLSVYRAYFKGWKRDYSKTGKVNDNTMTDRELCATLVNACTKVMEAPDPTPTDPATVTPGKTDRKTPGKTDPAPLTATPTDPTPATDRK